MAEEEKKKKTSKKTRNKTPDYIAAALVHVVLIYIFSRLTTWFDFLAPSFAAILWLFYLSFSAQIAFNLIYLVYGAKWFRALTRLVTNLFSIVVIYIMLVVFPFSLNEANSGIARIVLYIILFAVAIAILVETLKFVIYLLTQKEEVLNE